MTKSVTRKSSPAIKVRCLPQEKSRIEAMAKSCGLSTSAYLRALGLNYQPKSILDLQTVPTLAKVNADQGRLGGLLKMLLTNDNRLKKAGKEQTQKTITSLLNDIKRTEDLLYETVQSLKR